MVNKYNGFIHNIYGLEVWGNSILPLQTQISVWLPSKNTHITHGSFILWTKNIGCFQTISLSDLYIFMHDLINGRVPHTVIDYLFIPQTYIYQTRNEEKCNIKSRTSTYKHWKAINFLFWFIRNNLLVNFWNKTRRNRFCRLLKQELLKEY